MTCMWRFYCRSHAIACVNQFIFHQSAVVLNHIGSYLQVGGHLFLLFFYFTDNISTLFKRDYNVI